MAPFACAAVVVVYMTSFFYSLWSDWFTPFPIEANVIAITPSQSEQIKERHPSLQRMGRYRLFFIVTSSFQGFTERALEKRHSTIWAPRKTNWMFFIPKNLELFHIVGFWNRRDNTVTTCNETWFENQRYRGVDKQQKRRSRRNLDLVKKVRFFVDLLPSFCVFAQISVHLCFHDCLWIYGRWFAIRSVQIKTDKNSPDLLRWPDQFESSRVQTRFNLEDPVDDIWFQLEVQQNQHVSTLQSVFVWKVLLRLSMRFVQSSAFLFQRSGQIGVEGKSEESKAVATKGQNSSRVVRSWQKKWQAVVGFSIFPCILLQETERTSSATASSSIPERGRQLRCANRQGGFCWHPLQGSSLCGCSLQQYAFSGQRKQQQQWKQERFQVWTFETRSSAQGNCSAKSLEASVMSSILPCPPCLPPVMLYAVHRGGVCLWWGGLAGGGGSGWREGVQGTFQSSCHILYYHMVLCPKGTSHNKVSLCIATVQETQILSRCQERILGASQLFSLRPVLFTLLVIIWSKSHSASQIIHKSYWKYMKPVLCTHTCTSTPVIFFTLFIFDSMVAWVKIVPASFDQTHIIYIQGPSHIFLWKRVKKLFVWWNLWLYLRQCLAKGFVDNVWPRVPQAMSS